MPIEFERKAVGDGGVTHVEARFTGFDEQVIIEGFGDFVMNGFNLDVSDCEFVGRCKLYGEIDGGSYVALEWVCKYNGMRVWVSRLSCHFFNG